MVFRLNRAFAVVHFAVQTGFDVGHAGARGQAAPAVGCVKFVAVGFERAAVVNLAAFGNGGGVVVDFCPTIDDEVFDALVEHAAADVEVVVAPFEAEFSTAGGFGFEVAVQIGGGACAFVSQQGFVQAGRTACLIEVCQEGEVVVDVPNRADAGVELTVQRALFAGGVVFEMVVTQAGGQGNGVQVPDAFRVHAVFGFLLFVAVIQAENLQPCAFVGRLGGFVAVVDAVFHHVSVAE